MMMQVNTEIVLFYINDKRKQIEKILPVFTFNNQNISPSEMIRLCVSSINKNMPNAKIVLITNSETNIHKGLESIKVINADNISHERLLYDMHCFRRNYIENKINAKCNLIFTDIDILINKNMDEVFEKNFDIATTIDPNSNLELDVNGLPVRGSYMFNFTGGIYFIKPSSNVLKFYDYFLEEWFYLNSHEDFVNYAERQEDVKTNFLRWWGELHTLSKLFGHEVLTGVARRKKINDAELIFLPEEKYNFAPPMIDNNNNTATINLKNLEQVSMIHFRGGRKIFMPAVYKKYIASAD
jgi:hypothetical protein